MSMLDFLAFVNVSNRKNSGVTSAAWQNPMMLIGYSFSGGICSSCLESDIDPVQRLSLPYKLHTQDLLDISSLAMSSCDGHTQQHVYACEKTIFFNQFLCILPF